MNIVKDQATEDLLFQQWEAEVAQLKKENRDLWRKLAMAVMAVGGEVRIKERDVLLTDPNKLELVVCRDVVSGDFILRARVGP